MTTFNKYLDNPTVRITLFVGGIDEKVGWVKIGVSGMRVRFQNHSGLRCNTEKSLQFGNQGYKLVVSFRFCTFRPFCEKIVCSSPLLSSALLRSVCDCRLLYPSSPVCLVGLFLRACFHLLSFGVFCSVFVLVFGVPFWAFVVFVVCSLALSLGARLAFLVRVPACAATTGWSRLCRPLFCVLCRAFFVFCLVSCCCPCCVRLVYVAFLCCRWSRLFGAFVAFSFVCFFCCFSFLSSAALSSFVFAVVSWQCSRLFGLLFCVLLSPFLHCPWFIFVACAAWMTLQGTISSPGGRCGHRGWGSYRVKTAATCGYIYIFIYTHSLLKDKAFEFCPIYYSSLA